MIAEYALRDLEKPIGVAEWQTRLVQSLPEHLRGSLPTIAELEVATLLGATRLGEETETLGSIKSKQFEHRQ